MLATDCGPTPTHTLLANEASPQQKVAVNYGRLRRTDELSCALRARLLIQLFKVIYSLLYVYKIYLQTYLYNYFII